MVLRDLVGPSNEEVAAAHELTVQAAKSRIHRGRLQLRELLEPEITEQAPAHRTMRVSGRNAGDREPERLVERDGSTGLGHRRPPTSSPSAISAASRADTTPGDQRATSVRPSISTSISRRSLSAASGIAIASSPDSTKTTRSFGWSRSSSAFAAGKNGAEAAASYPT